MFDFTNRYDFLAVAVLFEGSLIGVAGGMGWWLDVDPLGQFAWDIVGAGWGLAATVPMFALFLAGYRAPLRRIRQLLVDVLGPPLAACRWYDLLLVAAVAGIGEELLFRGVLHPALGWVGSNIVFGLAHSISPLYAVLAAGMGLFLGWLLDASGNLLAPVVAHGLYDFFAFVVVAREYRRRG